MSAQDISRAARQRAAGAADQQFLEEAAADGGASAPADASPPAAAVESAYDAELRSELQVLRTGCLRGMLSGMLARRGTLLICIAHVAQVIPLQSGCALRFWPA